MAGDNITALEEELRRAKQNLSEVIDECLFVEHQRDMTERRMREEIRKYGQFLTDTLSSMLSLVDYLSLFERKVVIPALGTINGALEKIEDVGAARSSAFGHIEGNLRTHNQQRLREIMAKMQPLDGEIDNEMRRAMLKNPAPFSVEEAYTLIYGLWNAKEALIKRLREVELHLGLLVTEAHPVQSIAPKRSDEVQELRQRVEALMQQLQTQNGEKQKANSPAAPDKTFRNDNGSAREMLHLSGDSVVSSKLGSSRHVSSPNGRDFAAASAEEGNGIVDQKELIIQLKTNEMMIGTLNKELANLEEEYRMLKMRSAKEREDLQAELLHIREKHEEEQKECDSVLGRVTMELEQLVIENARLKKRLKGIYSKKCHT